ncbi:MAG TPA: choice-of-anchor Q domain-containing protein, partial [Anaerolineae bacterium]|nr:choice-of-anchor Q domain-containing protein [Anaerolineae bacterium]
LDLIHATLASPTVVNGAAIFVNSGTAHITNTIIASHTTGIQQTGGTASEDYNLFFGNTTDRVGIGVGANSLTGNPAFANLTIDDYKLTASSVAINKGLGVGVSNDFEGETRPQGVAPDIGYDESPFATLTYIYLPLVSK